MARLARDRRTVEGATSDLMDDLSETGGKLQRAAAHALPAAREQIYRAADNISAHTATLERWLYSLDRQRTIAALICTAGVGALAWWWLRRR